MGILNIVQQGTQQRYSVLHKGGKAIGEIYQEVDGEYVFIFQEPPTGCFSIDFFDEIATALKWLNLHD